MPRATTSSLPLSGLFAINKPSGMTSMAVIEALKPLFRQSLLFVSEEAAKEAVESKGKSRKFQKRRGPKVPNGDIKIGQGGTLDPLADGVLVIGINKGTKKLSSLLDCTKTYISTGLLNCSTDTYDSQGLIVKTFPHSIVSEDMVQKSLTHFRGRIMQLPPIYSALKMDGKPLYAYARDGQPLPRPIQMREANISNLMMKSWMAGGTHHFSWPEHSLDSYELNQMDKVESMVDESMTQISPELPAGSVNDSGSVADKLSGENLSEAKGPFKLEPQVSEEPVDPPAFILEMTVSSGTYVRSIIHDIGRAVGTAAHVVTLRRTVQGDFTLDNCVEWEVLHDAAEQLKKGLRPEESPEEWQPWEEAILKVFKSI